MKKLYVGQLSYSSNETGLASLFRQFGSVRSVKIATDHLTGRSRGFGFVEMEDAHEGDAAASALNGALFDGRTIVVNEARPREGGMRGPGSRPEGNRSYRPDRF